MDARPDRINPLSFLHLHYPMIVPAFSYVYRPISSQKGNCCEMASISRSIPFFCLEIPDAITNESPLRKDDNLGLRGCNTQNARPCPRHFRPLTRFINATFSASHPAYLECISLNHFSTTFREHNLTLSLP